MSSRHGKTRALRFPVRTVLAGQGAEGCVSACVLMEKARHAEAHDAELHEEIVMPKIAELVNSDRRIV